MEYTEDDLEFDCNLYLSEMEDLTDNWLVYSNITGTQFKSAEETALHNAVSSHLKTVRYLNFAKSVLEVEISNTECEIDGTTNVEIERSNISREYSINSGLCNLPLTMHVGSIAGIDKMIASHESQELRRRQLKKDVERDTLLINGNRVAGAQIGVDSVLQMTGDICDQILAECGLKALDLGTKEAISEAVLSIASRTHSGGIAFQALQSLTDPLTHMLIPQSAAALPIKVNVSVGAFPSVYYSTSKSSAKKWGLVCHIYCQSVFQVVDRDVDLMDEDGPGSAESSAMVCVEYCDFVLLDLRTLSADRCRAEHIVSNTAAMGVVTLSLQKG